MVDPNLLRQAFKTVATCAAAGAGIGGAAGAALGLLMPGYYRSVFAGGLDPSFAPVPVGFGLGLGQGALVGALLGVALSFRGRPAEGASAGARSSLGRSPWLLWLAVGVLALQALLRDVPGLSGPSAPTVAWRDGKVEMWNFGLGDVLVTHLVAGTTHASLPRPALLRGHMERETIDVEGLAWQEPDGDPARPPKPGEPIGAAFVRAGQATFLPRR